MQQQEREEQERVQQREMYGWSFSYHRVVWYLEMEAYMMECGTRVKDVVLEHSTSRMETCSKAHGEKI
ncbi:unnamed protein product [Brassica oleracea]